jgi:hypothetical protein
MGFIASNLARLLAFACIALFAGCVWFAAEARTQRERVTALELEIAAREIEGGALEGSRAVLSLGRADVDSIVRSFLRESANAPLEEVCRNDPAFARAYDAIDRMRDAHENALRDAPGGNPSRAASDADQKSGR